MSKIMRSMGEYTSYGIDSLPRLREVLRKAEMCKWIDILNESDPEVKLMALYRLEEKHDNVLNKFSVGTEASNYFDSACHKQVNLYKLDMSFLSICYQLMMTSSEQSRSIRVSTKRKNQIKEAFVNELTSRKYSLPSLDHLKAFEDKIIFIVKDLSPFVQWERRVTELAVKTGKTTTLSENTFEVARENLIKIIYLVYEDSERINTAAYSHCLKMAMQQPGKLLMFLKD